MMFEGKYALFVKRKLGLVIKLNNLNDLNNLVSMKILKIASMVNLKASLYKIVWGFA